MDLVTTDKLRVRLEGDQQHNPLQVIVAGIIDIHNSVVLKEALVGLVSLDRPVDLCLEGVEFLDGQGVKVIENGYAAAHGRECTFRIIRLSDRARHALRFSPFYAKLIQLNPN